jgi:hypothetical protein
MMVSTFQLWIHAKIKACVAASDCDPVSRHAYADFNNMSVPLGLRLAPGVNYDS